MKKNQVTLLNDALDCFVFNPDSIRIYVSTLFFGKDTLGITSRTLVNKYNEAIAGLLEGEVGKKISRGFLKEYVQGKIYLKLKGGARFTDVDAREFREYVSSLPVKSVRVIREVKGARLSENAPPLSFGRFTFYDWTRHLQILKACTEDDFSKEILDIGKHSLVVECTVESSDDQKSLELAELEFSKLESLVTFMIGRRDSGFEFGICNYKGIKDNHSYLIFEGLVGVDFRAEGAHQTIQIDDEFFTESSGAKARLVNLNENTANGLERKVLRSVEWLSHAITEINPASAFMKTATALEVLFSVDEKGVISSSLMAKFSEGCAQILGDSAEQCMLIEKEIKRLYGVRSAVVHSGKSNVSSQDLNSFIAYVRTLILKILADVPYSNFTTMEQLQDYLSKRKYQRLESLPIGS